MRDTSGRSPALQYFLSFYAYRTRLNWALAITILFASAAILDQFIGEAIRLNALYGIVILLAFSFFGPLGVVWLAAVAIQSWFHTRDTVAFANSAVGYLAFICAGGLIYWITRTMVRIQKAQTIIQDDLKQAVKVQQQLLSPPLRLPWIAAEGKLRPARQLAGDFYLFEKLDPRTVFFAIGDVEGKGVAAALTMSKIAALMNDLAKECPCLNLLLSVLNETLCRLEFSIATLFVGIVRQLEGGKVRLYYAKAGHENGILIEGNGGSAELTASGLPLGVICGEAYEEKSVDLSPGTRLLLYTDGVVEALPGRRGLAREELAEKAATLAPRFPVEDVGSWLDRVLDESDKGEKAPEDDMAVVGISLIPS